MSVFTLSAATIDTLQGTVNVGFTGVFDSLSAGSDTMLVLNLSIAPEASARSIQIATPQLAPSNYPMFVRPSTLDGVVPELVGFTPAQRDDTLTYTAYSPVDLIVIDPANDSIGVDFNFIPDASYDTTQDVNLDGEKDDVVIIPKPLLGDYMVKVIAEPGSDTGHYTVSVKLNGNEENSIASGEVPGPGEVDTVFYPVGEYLRGDANTDSSTSVSDVIFLINYLFKGGEAPEPLFLGDVNCCQESEGGNCEEVKVSVSDVIYLINYLFKGGDAPCS